MDFETEDYEGLFDRILMEHLEDKPADYAWSWMNMSDRLWQEFLEDRSSEDELRKWFKDCWEFERWSYDV